jgi:hypothetical protein
MNLRSLIVFIFLFRYIQIIVIGLNSSALPADPPYSFTSDKISTVNESVPILVPYVTAQLTVHQAYELKTFVIGDGLNYGQTPRKRREAEWFRIAYDESGKQVTRDRRSDDSAKATLFYNRPLKPNSNYSVFQRTFMDEVSYLLFECTRSDSLEPSLRLIILF